MESLPEGPFSLICSFLTLVDLIHLDSTSCALQTVCRKVVWNHEDAAHRGAVNIPALQQGLSPRQRVLLWHKVHQHGIKVEQQVLQQQQQQQQDEPGNVNRRSSPLSPSRVKHMASTDFRGYTAFFVQLSVVQAGQSNQNDNVSVAIAPLWEDFVPCASTPLHGLVTLSMQFATLDWASLWKQEEDRMDISSSSTLQSTSATANDNNHHLYLTILGVTLRKRGRILVDTISAGKVSLSSNKESSTSQDGSFTLSLPYISIYHSGDLSVRRHTNLTCRHINNGSCVPKLESITVSHTALEMEAEGIW